MARLKDIAVGVKDLFMLNPQDIQEEPGWNVRQPSAQLDEHIRQLADSIKEIGVLEPVTVYLKDNTPILTNGHCRLMAVRLAISEGAEIKAIPARAEERYANDADRVLGMITRNSGKPLTPFESSEVIKRLMAFSWSITDIVNKTGFSRTHINNLLELSAAPPAISEMVKNNTVSAKTALKTIRREGNNAQNVLTAAVNTAKQSGKTRATEKHIEKPITPATTQHVQWVKCSDQLPDSESTVMTYEADSQEPIWPGFHDGETWKDLSGFGINPSHWMEFPEPPVDCHG